MAGGDGRRGQQRFRIGGNDRWVGAEANVGPMCLAASVALLLKIIYQHVSGSDMMDTVQFD